MNSSLKNEAIEKIINSSSDKVSKLLIFIAGMDAQEKLECQTLTDDETTATKELATV